MLLKTPVIILSLVKICKILYKILFQKNFFFRQILFFEKYCIFWKPQIIRILIKKFVYDPCS